MSVRRLGSGKELVWIHGLGESSTSFEPVVANLPQFAHTLVDLPGYGRSAWPDEPLGLEALADHLAAWLKARPLATVLGHSMGGVLAVMLAERGATNAIVDIDGNVTRADCTFSAQATAGSEADFVERGFAVMRDQIYRDGLAEAPLRTYHAALCFAQARTYYKQASDLVALSVTETMAPRLAALTIPSLFVAGVPGGISQASRAELDRHGVRWIGIEPAGHWVYLDQLDKFVEAVTQFVCQPR